jgi:hypothetical protein
MNGIDFPSINDTSFMIPSLNLNGSQVGAMGQTLKQF